MEDLLRDDLRREARLRGNDILPGKRGLGKAMATRIRKRMKIISIDDTLWPDHLTHPNYQIALPQ